VVAPLRVAFFGTPTFAARSLQAIHASAHRVVAVITQPDRPRGRGQRLVPSPVKTFALEHEMAVLQPERLKDEPFRAALAAAGPEIAVVAAYGRILPESLIAAPRLGTVNVHASLLPRWRGAAPVHRAILAGDRVTGVTIMRMVFALDAGPMLRAVPTPIGPDETSAELEARLADLGSQLVVEVLDALAAEPIAGMAQDEQFVTYAARLEKREGILSWRAPADEIHNRIRGLQPWPLASVSFRQRRLLLLGSRVVGREPVDAAPGTVCDVLPDAILVAASPGTVALTRVQPEGRPAMAVRDFLSGHPVERGDRFETLPSA
jgi:methionyl-tRNA formyltransferase